MNSQTDNISTGSVSSSYRTELKSRELPQSNNSSNNSFIVINKKNELEIKTIKHKVSHQQTLSACLFIPTADPLLKRTKAPEIAPKFGKMKSYM